jgi:hypothetical protein
MSSYPSFTSLSEVITHLNATGPDSNSNYQVYGLSVSSTSVQAFVDHANKYLYSLIPKLQNSDIRWVSAELAALDIACLGVLVAVVGGSLVGAYDYFLGDLRVARSSPYASAIKTAITSYQADAKTNLQNVTSPVASAKAKLSENVIRRKDSRLDWR